jgi:NaMN:DMB phosphoribosyltransferase
MNWKNVLGGLFVMAAIVAVAAALPDVKRYIRISTM